MQNEDSERQLRQSASASGETPRREGGAGTEGTTTKGDWEKARGSGDTQLDEGIKRLGGGLGERTGGGWIQDRPPVSYDFDFHVTFIVHVSYYVTRPCKA